jgi:hypothetical protein
MKDRRSFSRVFGRIWPLALFSLPGVVAVGAGLWLGYWVIQDYYGPFIYHDGWGPLSVGLVLSGLLAFFAGIILSAINGLRSRVEEVAVLAARAVVRPVDTVFAGEQFIETPARSQPEATNR